MQLPQCKLITTEGKTYFLDRVFTIGRKPTCDLVLESTSASRIHATLVLEDSSDIHILSDGSLLPLKPSSNGVFVNGKKIKNVPLKHGDVISIAGFEFTYQCSQNLTEDGTYSGEVK